MLSLVRGLSKLLRSMRWELLFFGGSALLTVGLALAWMPFAFIIPGLTFIGLSLLGAWTSARWGEE